MFTSDADIRQAVQKYCQRVFSTDLSLDPPFVFSERHTRIMQKMLSRADRKCTAKRVAWRTAACLAAALVIFVAACVASPRVWAAVRSWYVSIISPDMLVYDFNHEENDHAFLVVRPDNLPEGFIQTEHDEGDGYSKQAYASDTGEYLNFSYHWATVGELKKIERLEKKYGTIEIYLSQQAIVYTEKSINKLIWYDKYSKISYWAESNMDQEALIRIFKESIEMHPPIYEPTWLPEGYYVYDNYIDPAVCYVSYLNENTQDIISVDCSDLGETDRMFVFGDSDPLDLLVNNKPVTVYIHEDSWEGTDLVLIDDSANVVITIQTGIKDPELVTKIAESLIVVDSYSRYIN